jgi:hypothetical protein
MAATGSEMYALDPATGSILRQFAAGGSVGAHPAIADGTVNWSSGFITLFPGSSEAIEANPPYLLARGASSTRGWPIISIRPASMADGDLRRDQTRSGGGEQTICRVPPSITMIKAGRGWRLCALSIDMVYSPYNL